MNRAALDVFRAGHTPITGEAVALPLVELAGSGRVGDAVFEEIFHPLARRLVARCDAVLRIGGESAGERRAMVAVGAQTVDAYRRITADVCFLGVWSLHHEHGLSEGYPEEAEVRRVLLERAGRVVGLASREKLGTVAPFAIGPAGALTHIATERGVPQELTSPFAELGIEIVS